MQQEGPLPLLPVGLDVVPNKEIVRSDEQHVPVEPGQVRIGIQRIPLQVIQNRGLEEPADPALLRNLALPVDQQRVVPNRCEGVHVLLVDLVHVPFGRVWTIVALVALVRGQPLALRGHHEAVLIQVVVIPRVSGLEPEQHVVGFPSRSQSGPMDARE